MFRPMRRGWQALSDEQCRSILSERCDGVLALSGDDGYPYAVPINHVFHNGKLYFHGAKEGHKVDAMRNEPKASYCVIDHGEIDPQQCTTRYRSVIAFGKLRILTDENEIAHAMDQLLVHLLPHIPENMRHRAIDARLDALGLFEMTVEHLSGKQSDGFQPEQ